VETKTSECVETLQNALTLRVLIADDSVSGRDLLRSILESSGYEVLEAESCEQVVQLAQSFDPRLILVDLKMSGTGGCGIAMKLRRIPQFAKTPIVALAAAAMDVSPDQMSQAGFSTYLVKPIGPARLRACVAKLL
jgi:two-component system sensor histidine kinase/response regulator